MTRVIVIGAGAAGTMAAIFAAESGTFDETLLLERTKDGGRKILISGGGRCNVLPARVDVSRFVTDSSPNLLRKLVRAWPLAEQRAFFEQTLGIPLVEEPGSAKLFPVSNKARDVRDGLLAQARAAGVRIVFDTRVTGIEPVHGPAAGVSGAATGATGASPRGSAPRWIVRIAGSEPLTADAVIVATGGLSVPNTGSDGAGLALLERLGHEMHPTYAALTPVTADAPDFGSLAGVSLRVTLHARSEAHDGSQPATAATARSTAPPKASRSATASGGFLFTHRGYSGPSVLDVSHVLVRARAEGTAARLTVQWTPLGDAEWNEALSPARDRPGLTVLGVIRAHAPDRLAVVLIARANVDPARPLTELRREERRRLIDTLVRGDLPWNGDEGYKKAEVTGGGVALGEVHPRTMESRRHAGLYLCGEVLDAFGPIGGYNFHWAWSTGRAAGLGAAAGALQAPV